MRILFLFNHPAPYKVAFYNELSKYMDVCAIFERGKNKDRSKAFYDGEKYKFEFHFLSGLNIGKENHYSNGFIKFLEKERNRFDAIVMNGYSSFTEIKSIHYLKKKKIPYILYVNGGFIKPNEIFLKRKLKEYLIKGAILYLSPDDNSNKYLEYYGAKKELIRNYPYSTIHMDTIVNKPLSIEEKQVLRKKLKINGEHLFISIGQFIKRKNNFSLLNLWKTMPANYTLLLIGDGPLKEEYEKFIKENDIKNIIIYDFIRKPDLFEYIKAADAVLFLSKHDIYGHVVNESLSQGTPVIASKYSNASNKLIKNDVNGYIVDISNEEEIKISIKNTTCKEFGENCIKVAKENTIEKMAIKHKEIFEEII